MIFFVGMSCATVLEYGTGTVMGKLFHTRYWDYSNNRFHLHGYICPLCSFGWGIFSVALIRILHPILAAAVLKIPATATALICAVLFAVYAADTALSVQAAL